MQKILQRWREEVAYALTQDPGATKEDFITPGCEEVYEFLYYEFPELSREEQCEAIDLILNDTFN